MMVNDPVADMLTRIRNACTAGHTTVEIPTSKLKVRIAEILVDEGFVASHTVREGTPRSSLVIELKYEGYGQPVIRELKRISKPGMRRYLRSGDIPKVRNGLGVMILSTSHGVMTDRKAREANVGGEPLCTIA